jgi:hypothetical protein
VKHWSTDSVAFLRGCLSKILPERTLIYRVVPVYLRYVTITLFFCEGVKEKENIDVAFRMSGLQFSTRDLTEEPLL